MSDVQSRERSPETASGAQRDPDERAAFEAAVRALNTYPPYDLTWLDGPAAYCAKLTDDLWHIWQAAALRRLQAAQREPVARVRGSDPSGKQGHVDWLSDPPPKGTQLYTQAQRDDHPTEGLPEEHENGFLLDNLLDACTYGDSYGVAGSDFTVCRICNAESGAGRLRKPEAEWHDKDCEYLKFKTAFKAASPERLQERLRFVLGCSNVETRNDGLVELLNEYQSALAAALAASKGTPDLEHPRSRETAAESLSVDTSVADRKDAARYRWLRNTADLRFDCGGWVIGFENWLDVDRDFPRTPRDEPVPCEPLIVDAAIDAAMSADVRDFVPPVSSPDQTLSAPSAVAQWMPIESAPRDERKVIIVGGHYGGAWHTEFSDSDDIRRWMTHWMPLPEPPKDVRSQAKETP